MMAGSSFWSVTFFLMMICIGMGSQMNHLLVVTTVLCDHSTLLTRHKTLTSMGVTVLCFIIGLSMCTQGGFYVFQILDRYGSAAFVMFLNGIWQCIAIGWCYGSDIFLRDVMRMTNEKCFGNQFFGICWKYITPVINLVLLIIV